MRIQINQRLPRLHRSHKENRKQSPVDQEGIRGDIEQKTKTDQKYDRDSSRRIRSLQALFRSQGWQVLCQKIHQQGRQSLQTEQLIKRQI